MSDWKISIKSTHYKWSNQIQLQGHYMHKNACLQITEHWYCRKTTSEKLIACNETLNGKQMKSYSTRGRNTY